MNRTILACVNSLLLVAAALLVVPVAVAGDDAVTEDVLVMNDGRELHGTIIEERPDAIVFQVVDAASGIRTKVTYFRSEIAEIHEDIVREAVAETKQPTRRRVSTSEPEDEPVRTFGARRADAGNENLPSFYIVPMKGQMGTDVNTDVYKDMVDDIRDHDPDILVIEMECFDEADMLYSLVGREEQGLTDFDEFRKLINLFHDELGDIRQVMWVKDSVGVSSTVALAWDELYMAPQARLGGLVKLQEIGFEKWADDDVRGKMTAAFMSWVKGFLEYGGYSLMLADAMVRPQYTLSGRWQGREVIWTLDTDGDYIVDDSDEETAEFRAKSAEDLCISDGTVENLDDLALLLGMREYRVLDGGGETMFEDYQESWRRTLENCKTWLLDYEQFLGWANGEDTLKYLGQAKGRLEKVLAAIERYNAVEVRLGMEAGIRKFDLITLIEQLKERIRALRQANRGAGRGGGGRGIGGGGGG
ncbi:MAG: hypothetical protein KJO43_12100 [Phycisphaerae bacterium]|nr:hypothetical protein [Phycisphaerae bacterium]NNF42693.1 hypothetical protein [Phycisphaerales bacterium]